MTLTLKDKLLLWRRKFIPQKYFILILAMVTGFSAGIAAVVIKNSVHFIQSLLTYGFAKDVHNYLYFIYPLLGLWVNYLIIKKLFNGEEIGHGIPNTLYAISKRHGIIKKQSIYSSILTSAVTVGFGGSVGLEGPTVSTSSAIGSNIGQFFKQSYKGKILLIGAACSGALSAIFNAPIAAIVFAIEVIMLDLTTASLIPLLLASVSAAITSRLFLGDEVLFHFSINDHVPFNELGYFIILGIFCGIFSIYFSKTYFGISENFEKIKSFKKRVVIAGIILGVLVFVFPPLYGEGFSTINALIEGNVEQTLHNSLFYKYSESTPVVILFMILVILFKAIATSVTFGGGGIGGIFAPTLFMGSMIGFLYALIFNYLQIENLSYSNYTLVAMAGLMAGNLQAPLTAIFLIAEITGGYALFIPLMITTSISFLTVKMSLPYSVYTLQLAKRGELITHHKDKAILTLMNLQHEIETNFSVISPDMTLRQLVKVIAKSKRNLFPVVDKQNILMGVVYLDDVREMMFDTSLYDKVKVSELMNFPNYWINYNDDMEDVMEKFEKSEAWNLPVVRDGQYIGFVSRSKLFNEYRKILKDLYNEE